MVENIDQRFQDAQKTTSFADLLGQLQIEKLEKKQVVREKEEALKELRTINDKCEFIKMTYDSQVKANETLTQEIKILRMKLELQEEDDQYKSKLGANNTSISSLRDSKGSNSLSGGQPHEKERREQLVNLIDEVRRSSRRVTIGEILKTIQQTLTTNDIKNVHESLRLQNSITASQMGVADLACLDQLRESIQKQRNEENDHISKQILNNQSDVVELTKKLYEEVIYTSLDFAYRNNRGSS